MKTASEILRANRINTKSSTPGRYYATCPQCSAQRKQAHQNLRCLGLTIGHDGLHWGCNHCGWTGGRKYEDFVRRPAPLRVDEGQRAPRRAVETGNRTAASLRIWHDAEPLSGTLGERYFMEHRRIDVRRLDVEHVLRWHAGIAAVVALMTDAATNRPTGVHRTFINADGSKRERKMLGRKGAIRLSRDEDVCEGLGIVEGIEDGLSVLSTGWAPVWAACDAGAIARFPVLSGVKCLTVFADADPPGMRAAQQCAATWRSAKREARVLPPPRGVI